MKLAEHQIDDLHQMALVAAENRPRLEWFLNFIYAAHVRLAVLVIRRFPWKRQ